MQTVQDSVDVAVPVTTAYNQWTQFEAFPAFMSGVEQVHQLSERRTHWKTNVHGVQREFDAEITEQRPDERIAWTTVDGLHHAGVVTFHRIDDHTTRVSLQLEFAPEGLVETAGAALGVVGMQAKGDLARFKEFIEQDGTATGAWRGEIGRPPQAGEGEGIPPQAGQGEPGPASSQPPTGPRGPAW